MKKFKYQGWKGSLADHYFGHLEKGIWVDISILKYWWLKLNGYTTRKINNKSINEKIDELIQYDFEH